MIFFQTRSLTFIFSILGKETNLSLDLIDYIPNLDDFDAMLDKQETLSDFFMDLDTDKDGKITLQEVITFLEDIGKTVTPEELQKEIRTMQIDENGNIDRDGFIELMFPKFQMQ